MTARYGPAGNIFLSYRDAQKIYHGAVALTAWRTQYRSQSHMIAFTAAMVAHMINISSSMGEFERSGARIWRHCEHCMSKLSRAIGASRQYCSHSIGPNNACAPRMAQPANTMTMNLPHVFRESPAFRDGIYYYPLGFNFGREPGNASDIWIAEAAARRRRRPLVVMAIIFE